jgi:hypothetical protein
VNQPQKIEGTNDYSYKGFTIGKYMGGAKQTTAKWLIEKDSKEVYADINTLQVAQNTIDVYLT